MALILSILVFLNITIPSIGEGEINDILHELDKTIERRETFRTQKERRLHGIKEDLESVSPDARFVLCHKLFDEYKYYQYDSAYYYAKKLESAAEASGSAEELIVARSALLFCFKSVGFFNEAVSVIDASEKWLGGGIPDNILVSYYMLCAETYQNLSSYVSGSEDLVTKYDGIKVGYYEKALSHCTENTYNHAWITLELALINGYSEDLAIDGRRRLISMFNLTEHDQAVQYSILASALASAGMEEESIYYRAISAINDIRSCTHETTAAKALAESLYYRNEIPRSYRYIQQALFDARFYNSRLRMVEINTVLPKIESRRYDWINNQRVLSFIFAGIVLLLLTVTFILLIKLRRRNRQLSDIHRKLVANSKIIRQKNESLSELNGKLKEANEIKDEYIISSLYSNSYFVNEVERQSLSALRKIRTRQYDDAIGMLNNMGIKKERERMYAAFDSAFLKLFPNFISEFNNLFPPASRFRMDDDVLPMEVRIFALLRLGIDNAVQVAEYLNLSVNTVYVYKTKVKSKASVPKEEFENMVKAIPKP